MRENDSRLTQSIAQDGYAFPLDVLGPEQAQQLLDELEAAEAELSGDEEKLALLAAYPDRLLPSFDELIRHRALTAPVSQVLGEDLMVWSAALFSKPARSPKIVSWHQDLTYWGLDDAHELTAWFALSPATCESGCMKFIPGSHHQQLLAHQDTFATNNLLTRGQEVAVSVDESAAVPIVLDAGQASLHHGHLIHSSGPNRSDYRRVGVAIRYIRPSMRQQTGDSSLVALVSGDDHYRHFTIAEPPRGRLTDDDFERCRVDAAIKRRLLFAGADEAATRV